MSIHVIYDSCVVDFKIKHKCGRCIKTTVVNITSPTGRILSSGLCSVCTIFSLSDSNLITL